MYPFGYTNLKTYYGRYFIITFLLLNIITGNKVELTQLVCFSPNRVSAVLHPIGVFCRTAQRLAAFNPFVPFSGPFSLQQTVVTVLALQREVMAAFSFWGYQSVSTARQLQKFTLMHRG